MASEGIHEATDRLAPETLERHRAVRSLIEELDAIDWYEQRVDASADEDLRRVLRHNRDEEVEHAVLVLEWLRRSDPVLDRELRRRLFQEGSLLVEEPGESPAPAAGPPQGSLGIGSLREVAP